MGLRQKLNENPAIAVAGTVVIAVVAAFFGFRLMTSHGFVKPQTAYYTVDDGKTLFADLEELLPPFQHEGKEAVRARVMSCDAGSTKFVAYLEKYTDAYKAARTDYNDKMKAIAAKAVPQANEKPPTAAELGAARAAAPQAPDRMRPDNTFVKKPGDTEWVLETSPKGQKVVNQKCPNGSYVDLVEQYP